MSKNSYALITVFYTFEVEYTDTRGLINELEFMIKVECEDKSAADNLQNNPTKKGIQFWIVLFEKTPRKVWLESTRKSFTCFNWEELMNCYQTNLPQFHEFMLDLIKVQDYEVRTMEIRALG